MVTKTSKRLRPRVGRPSKDLAGNVQTRILDAAQSVFLERGFQAASVDEIAELAPASKPTIYAHFPGKEALFAAVVARIISDLTNFEGYTSQGRTAQDKLISLSTALVQRAIEDSVELFRATIAESKRFPQLSRDVHDASVNRAVSAVSRLLNDATHVLARTPKGPFGEARSLATAQIFMDLIVLPMLMRSLMGAELKELRKYLPSFVRERVGFFLAACATDWGSDTRGNKAASG